MVLAEGEAKALADGRRIVFSQYREFFGYEGSDPNILEPNGVEHSGGGREKPGGGGALDRFAGKALGDEAAKAVQVNKMGEFEAVTKGSAGGENRIPQAQRANFYAEVHGASGSHFMRKHNTKYVLASAGSGSRFVSDLPSSRLESARLNLVRLMYSCTWLSSST